MLDLFERYGVQGDFSFTPEITRELASKYPSVADRIKHSSHTIANHFRPPHRAYPGFDQRSADLAPKELYSFFLEQETNGLGLVTGELVRRHKGLPLCGVGFRSQAGGSLPNQLPPTIREVGQKLFRDLGARMTVLYRESGTPMAAPFAGERA
ncbi:MAG: hypothetical protein ACUVRY_09875 [Thermoanaerobaculaceae bacterium]